MQYTVYRVSERAKGYASWDSLGTFKSARKAMNFKKSLVIPSKAIVYHVIVLEEKT